MTFTLDNGYLSDEAKTNIVRVTEQLGVRHVFGTTDAMNAIFVDSLERHGNVCNGCFKTLYTLGARLARAEGIPLVMTGLSRGQFFETRLTEELFLGDASEIERIDPIVLEARKAYHRTSDAVADLLDTRDFADDALFDDVEFIDFYRYCDVTLDEMLAWLARNVPWIRPSDTGRSTNCRINQVGIFVHRHERGFHNYALPYSWDVRMGHMERDAALAELDDDIDVDEVRRILDEIGYEGPAAAALKHGGEAELVGYWVGDAVDDATLRAHLATRLPRAMVPRRFVRIDEVPLTHNGKVDRSALPRRDARRVSLPIAFQGPRSPLEERIAAVWCEVLEADRVGVDDAFLELGGNSLLAIQVISRVNHAFDVDLPLRSAFEASTIESLARLVERTLLEEIEALTDAEAERLAVSDR
jgi:acyl carrier protein